MKTALFAAAMLFAAPAFAQTTGGTGSGTPVGADAKASTATGQTSTDAQTTTPPMSSSDSTMSSQSSMPMSGQSSMGGSGSMTAGGYQPSTPMPMASGGQQPVFQPGQSVAQAYPAPAPLASYPICKKGQYDKCMQRGGR